MSIFCIFIFSGCQEITNSSLVERQEMANDGDINEDFDIVDITGMNVPVVEYENVNMEYFSNNPILSTEENEEIKNAIIDIILYMFGFDIDYNNILSVVDEKSSEIWAAKWLSDAWYYEEGWTVVDEISRIRDFNRYYTTISSIQANFMMRANLNGYNGLHISVPIYPMYRGEVGGYELYDFFFEKIDGRYKLVGIMLGR